MKVIPERFGERAKFVTDYQSPRRSQGLTPLLALGGGAGKERSSERGCSEAGRLYTGYSGAIMRKNHVAERNGGLIINHFS